MMSKKEMNFDEAIEKMEKIVEELEGSDINLEKSMTLFQEGMGLSKLCHEKLQKVEEKIHTLVEKEDGFDVKEIEIEKKRDD